MMPSIFTKDIPDEWARVDAAMEGQPVYDPRAVTSDGGSTSYYKRPN